MPPMVRENGESKDSLETTLSGLPLNATRVPRRVRRFWDAES